MNKYLSVIAVAILLGSCSKTPQGAAPPPVVVEIGPVKNSNVKDSTEFTAKLEGVQNATIQPRVSGQVSQVYVNLGDRVPEGTPLLQIDPSKQQATLDGRIAQITSAKADLESSLATLNSLQADRQRIVAQLQFNSQKADLENARASLSALRADRDKLIATLNYNSERANLENAKAALKSQEAEKNRILAELNYNSELSALENSKANLLAQKAARDNRAAKVEYEKIDNKRYAELFAGEVISKQRLDQANLALNQAQTELGNQEELVNASQANVDTAQRNFDRKLKTLEAQISAQDEVINAGRAKVESAQKDLERTVQTLDAQIASQDQAIKGGEARVSSAEQDLERTVKTLEAQIAEQDEKINAQQGKIRSLQGVVSQTQANAVEQQVELKFYEITAPFDGTVGNINVKVGDFVNQQTELTSIRRNDALEIAINIPIDKLSQVKRGTLVEILDNKAEVIGESRVAEIAPNANNENQTLLIKAVSSNPGNKLRTNQIVTARVIWEQDQGLTVPTTAVLRTGSQSFVFVVENVNRDGKTTRIARQRPVKLGTIQGQSFAVLSGLKDTDQIVVSGVVKLRDGVGIIEPSQIKPSPKVK